MGQCEAAVFDTSITWHRCKKKATDRRDTGEVHVRHVEVCHQHARAIDPFFPEQWSKP